MDEDSQYNSSSREILKTHHLKKQEAIRDE